MKSRNWMIISSSRFSLFLVHNNVTRWCRINILPYKYFLMTRCSCHMMLGARMTQACWRGTTSLCTLVQCKFWLCSPPEGSTAYIDGNTAYINMQLHFPLEDSSVYIQPCFPIGGSTYYSRPSATLINRRQPFIHLTGGSTVPAICRAITSSIW